MIASEAPRTPVVRIRPVPRCEPRADGEVPGVAAPPDPATGVRVRRARGSAADGPRRRGVVAGAAQEAEPQLPPRPAPVGASPAVAPSPPQVVAVVTAALHTPPRPADPATVVAPGLSLAPEAAPPESSRELRLAARQLLGTCVEVIGGFRPVAQLRPYCAPERFDAIVNRLLRPTGIGRGHGATRGSVVTRATRPGRPAKPLPQDRVAVRRVQICTVMEGIAELAVVMSRRGKVWAMALRLERSRGRWQCMHLEIL